MKKKSRPIASFFSRRTELPLEYLTNCDELHLLSASTLYLDGVRKVLRYESEIISLLCRERIYQVSGERLLLHSFFDGKIRITGKITGIGIEEERGMN